MPRLSFGTADPTSGSDAAILDRAPGNRHCNSTGRWDTPQIFPRGYLVMGKTVAASRAEVPNWFHVGVIAPPGYDAPGFEAQVARKLAKLLGPKSQTHKIGIYGVWVEPVSRAVVAASKENDWHLSGYAVDRLVEASLFRTSDPPRGELRRQRR